MIVFVEGIELPGRRCGPNPQGEWYENIHVGLCTRDRRHPGSVEVTPRRPWVVTNLVAGDAPSASWQLEIIVRSGDDGVDFDGPLVRGKRGDRYIGLAWARSRATEPSGCSGAKLRLDYVELDVIRDAIQGRRRLVARVRLTDASGFPRCATVHPPDVTWSVEPTGPRQAPSPDPAIYRDCAATSAPGEAFTPMLATAWRRRSPPPLPLSARSIADRCVRSRCCALPAR